ncbi:hypothetical protein [Bradyrhizobium jicamae]|uniref:hypothetical protein n=1 Tax=Bradyrhizobium jicamae TaxID=280332 RepID=UPI0012ECEAED|nr:hypothetical protein [Bradyrhizobium jicamae]
MQKVYREARRAAGKHAVTMVLVANGATTGFLPDVPPANHARCMAALQKLIGNASAGTDAKRVDDDFDAIRAKAFGTPERPTPVKKLDPVGIFKRWNNPPPVDRDN